MRWPQYLLLVLAAYASIGVAQDAAMLKAIGSLPNCAQLCLATAVVESPCQLSDKQCVCANAELQSAAEKCVISSCTVKESLTTKNVTSALCDVPVRSETTHLRVANIVLAVVTGSCILLRFGYHAFFNVNGLNWDDFLVLATVLLAIPSVVIVDRCMLPNGIGVDVWNVPFDHIDNFIRWLYVVTLLYLIQAALVKITLLFFFLRIFLRRRTVRLLWGTIIFVGLWTFCIFIPASIPCLPVNDFWTAWDMERPTKCLNMDAVVWMHAIIGIALDIWMIAIPLYEVYHLQMTWVKKFGVALMFSLGTFVTVVSILRLKSLFFFDGDRNYTWKQAKVVLWSMYELHVGVICACIPTLRLIFIRAIPTVISSIQGSTQRSSANGNASRSRSRGTTQNADTLRSDRGGKEGLAVEPNTITYTRTFAVRHEENDEEAELVHMEDLSDKASRERGDSYTSELSL